MSATTTSKTEKVKAIFAGAALAAIIVPQVASGIDQTVTMGANIAKAVAAPFVK